MEKFLIEIFGVYGKSDADTKIESFVINSIGELEEAMEGYEEISSASFPHWGDWDEPDSYDIVRISFQDKLNEIEKEYKEKKQELYEKFGMKM